jgi:hypothetical protein
MPSKPRSLWDHYLDSVRLLARANEHLLMAVRDESPTSKLALALSNEIENHLNKRCPPFNG